MSNAAKCRFVGNMLEYSAARALKLHGGLFRNTYTKEKYERWERIYPQELCAKQRMPTPLQFDAVYKHLSIDLNKPISFELAKDTRMDTSDLYIYDQTDKPVALSLKNNNQKLRHQRPKALYKQLELNERATTLFQTDYNEINDRYYQMWSSKGHTLFSQLKMEEKQQMYDEVMDLTIKWLNKSPLFLDRYVRFLLKSTDSNTLCWYPDKGKFALIDQVKIKSTSFYEIKKQTTFIYISIDKLEIKIRIHNASSRITRKMQIKYDTSIDCKHQTI